jgi:hypothetical protein
MPGRAGAIEEALRLLLGRVEAAAHGELTGSGERRAFVSVGLAPMHASGSVRAMSAARPMSSAPPPAFQSMATIIDHPLNHNPLAATVVDQPLNHNPLASTVIDQPPIQRGSGAYSVVNRGDSVETVRARMLELGLDPNARTSAIPRPPPRRDGDDAPASSRPTAIAPVRAATRLQPNAVQRRAR